jgi:DNA-binding MarR family transcriptional regulator
MGQREVYAVCEAYPTLIDLNEGERCLLSLLAKYVGHDGYAWPGVSRLARDLGIQRRAIQRRLRRLEALGYIETVRRFDEDGTPQTNAYHLLRRAYLP